MSNWERLRLEQDMILNPDHLLVGARTNGLTHIETNQPVTLALDELGKPVDPLSAVFASRSLEVAIFCAAVYSRDGWSGWNTYNAADSDGQQYEFFAAPHVLRRAVMAMHKGKAGSAYRVRPVGFEPYGPIPGQYVCTGKDVIVEDEYRVDLMDMRQDIVNTAYLPRADRARRECTRYASPRLDLKFLLDECVNEAPVYRDLDPAQAAAEIRQYQSVRISNRSYV
jgi:hypothetical protein